MTQDIFKNWFHSEFVPEVSEFLKSKGLPQKAVLFLDNVPSHPVQSELKLADGNIFVSYLPPNVMSLIQPMDQGVIVTMKRHYRREMDDDANPFSGFEEEGDEQVLKAMKDLIEKEAQFDEVDEENIKQWLENDVEIPGHEIRGEDEIVGSLSEATTALEKNGEVKGEEDEIASSVCVPLQAALESADLLLRFMEQQDGTSTTDILNLRKIKMNINKKLSAAEVQKKMTDFFKKNNQ